MLHQNNTLTPHWSRKHGITLYRLKVDGVSQALLFDADALEHLYYQIEDLIFEPDED